MSFGDSKVACQKVLDGYFSDPKEDQASDTQAVAPTPPTPQPEKAEKQEKGREARASCTDVIMWRLRE